MKSLTLFLICVITLSSHAYGENDNSDILGEIRNAYPDLVIEHLLDAETSQDAKEKVLTDLIDNSRDAVLLTKLYCKRGKLRVVHTHLPKGVEDLQSCVDGLLNESSVDKRLLEEKQTELNRAKQKYQFTKELLMKKDSSLVTRYTALWKLGEREEAVKLVKAEAVPNEFSTLSTNRMVKAGFLCLGSSPDGPNKSFRLKDTGPFWWCDEL